MTSFKILCVIDDLGPGGAQRQLVNMAHALKLNGHTVKFVTYHKREFYQEFLIRNGIELIQLNEGNPVIRVINFRRFLRNSNFDVVISFLAVPSFLASFAAFPQKRWVLIVGERSSNPVMKRSLKSRLLRVFYFKADHIVANSYENIKLVQSMLPWLNQSKFQVIYNVIDLDLYKPDPSFRFRKNGKFKIVIPASYRRLKNLLGLIEAVNRLAKEEKDVLIIDWYGDKLRTSNQDDILNEAEILIRKYKFEDIFTLNDKTDDIYIKIQDSDAVGLFSFFEGLPNAICEGMACGKPVIATEVSDVPRLIENGKNGFLCSADNISSIADALSALLRLNEYSLIEFGKINLEKAQLLFNRHTIISQYQQLFVKK